MGAAVLSFYDIKKILRPDNDSDPIDDFRVIDSWTEYSEGDSSTERKLQYLCYEFEVMNPATGEKNRLFKAIRLCRVIRLPASATQATSFMDMQQDVLTAVSENAINLITVIANIIKPVPIGLLYLYGVQATAKTLEKAKEKARRDFLGFVYAMQAEFGVLEMRVVNEEEAEWLRDHMYSMDYMTVIRGIPKANKAGVDAGNKGVGSSNVNPDSQGTLENMIIGMVDYEYIIEILSTPVFKDTLIGWNRKNQKLMTEWYGQMQGTKSLSFNMSLPMSFGANVGTNSGWNRGFSSGHSENYSEGQSYNQSHGMSAGESLSKSFGRSVGHSVGENYGTSLSNGFTKSHGLTLGDTFSQSYNKSHGISQSVNQGLSFNQGVSHSQNVGQSLNQSHGTSLNQGLSFNQGTSQNSGISANHGVSQNQGLSFNQGLNESHGLNASHGTSQNQGLSYNQGTSVNHGLSVNHGVSENQGLSVNRGISQNEGLSYNHGTSINRGQSLTNTVGVSQGTSYNMGRSQNEGVSHSKGIGQNIGYGTNQSVNIGNSFNRGVSSSSSLTRGISENHGDSYGINYGSNGSASSGNNISGSDSRGNSSGWNLKLGGDKFPVGGGGTHSGTHTNSASAGKSTGYSLGWSNGANAGYSNSYGSSASGSVTNGNSASMGQSLGYSRGTSMNQGFSSNESYSTSSSRGLSESWGASMSQSNSQSRGMSLSQGESFSSGMSLSRGSSYSEGASLSRGVSDSMGASYSQGASESMGSSYSQGISDSLGSSYSQGTSRSAGASMSQGLSDSMGTTYSQGLSQSNGLSLSQGTSQSIGQGYSMGESIGTTSSVGQSYSIGNSISDSESFGISRSKSVSESASFSESQTLGQSYGKSVSDTVSDSSSLGMGKNIGESVSNGSGTSFSNGSGLSQSMTNGMSGGSTIGTSSSLGVGPSIGYNKSYQWLNQEVKDLLEILEYRNERYKTALRGEGMFYTYVYIACPSLDALSTAQTVAKTTWQNEFAMAEPIQVLSLNEVEQKHLLYHFTAFSADITEEDVYGERKQKYCTALLPQEYVAYTHLPRVSEGGVFSIVQDIPKFSVPSGLKGEIYMGTILSAERYSFENGYRTPYDYRIDESALLHGFFTGASRSGKTVAAMRFIKELAHVRRKKTGKRLRLVVMDPKQDWRGLARYVEPERFRFYSMGNPDFEPIKLNPWKVPQGVYPQHWIDTVIDIYCRSYGLLERGKQMLGDVIYELYEEAGVFDACDKEDWRSSNEVRECSGKVNFKAIYERMDQKKEALEAGRKMGNDTKDAYSRLLERLSCFSRRFSIESKLYGSSEGLGIDELIGGDDVTVLESKGLEKTFSNFIFGVITSGFYRYAICHDGGFLAPDQYETVLVIEEANEVLIGNDSASSGSSGPSLNGESEFEQIIDQAAGYGLFVFAITQKISDMPTSVLANAGLIFSGRLERPDDVTAVVRAVGREERIDDRDLVKWFPRSPIGYFVCKSARGFDFKEAEPVLVQIAKLDTETPSNLELSDILAQKEAYSILHEEEKSA